MKYAGRPLAGDAPFDLVQRLLQCDERLSAFAEIDDGEVIKLRI